LVTLNPAREVSDWTWVIIPLVFLAAGFLARFVEFLQEDRLVLSGHALIILILCVFAIFNVYYIYRFGPEGREQVIRWLGVYGAIILISGITLLVGWGWSGKTAIGGLVSGVSVLLIIYTVSMACRFWAKARS
jgi:hypothetical protein